MTYKALFALALCLTLSGCAGEPAEVPAQPGTEPATEAQVLTVAPIEGQTVSPDGKWEVVQEGVNEGVTAGGLSPCEVVRIVNTETGAVLWEEEGAYQLHAAWPEGSEFAVVARTARTWVEVQVISTRSGESVPVRLPGDKPIPEYTFLAENWLEWQDENTFELRLDGGDGVENYWCLPVEDPSETPLEVLVNQAVYENLPGDYDFTHDGQAEIVELVRVLGDDGRTDGELRPVWFELHISDADGEKLWKGEAYLAHMGWRNLFACAVGGQDYILDYSPYMGQGFANYGYRLFSLDENGEELPWKENDVSFDVNFGTLHFTGNYDPTAIGAFMDDVHTYLDGDCMTLLSTDGSGGLTDAPGSDYRGDDFTGGELYAYDGTWEERFRWFQETDPRG